MKYILVATFMFICFSCSSEKEMIFEIKTPKQAINFKQNQKLKEIKKVPKSFLTSTEVINSHYNYKNYGVIYESEKFKAILILSEISEKQIHHILVRTINNGDNKVIDTFLISSYNDKSKEFCSGYIGEDLMVSRTCNSVNYTLEKQIDEFGNFTDLQKK